MLLSVIEALLDKADRHQLMGDDRECSTNWRSNAHDDALRPATMVLLGLAAAELRTAAGVVSLDSRRPHRVHTVVGEADDLRSSFAAPGTCD